MVYQGVKIDGARQLRKTLKAAGDDLADFRATNKAAAGIAAGQASSWAPVRSGKLAQSVRSSGTLTAAIVRAGYKRIPYAGPIHWGWPSRHIKANPFLSYSAQATEPRWITLYHKHMEKSISKVEGI